MKKQIIAVTAVLGLFAVVGAADVEARGKGNGKQKMGGNTSATRPEGSQRRDGTFLTTGTTANGSTTRPGKGNGLQDGSRLNVTPVPAPVTAP